MSKVDVRAYVPVRAIVVLVVYVDVDADVVNQVKVSVVK